MDEKSTTSSVTKKKPGPKPQEAFDAKARINNLEACISKMAHMTGQQRVLDEFGIDRWEVTAASMKKGGR